METPRTNKNAGYYYGHGIKKNGDLVIDPNGPFVLADFARDLERENNDLREVLNKLTDCYFLHRCAGMLELMMQADRLRPLDMKGEE